MTREITFQIKKYDDFAGNKWIVWKIDNAATYHKLLGRFETEQLAEQFVMLKKFEL